MNIERLQQNYINLENQLQLARDQKDERMVTVYRGRLIKTLALMTSENYANNFNDEQLQQLRTELNEQINVHKMQINQRIHTEKLSGSRYSITGEVALKMRKVATSIRQIGLSQTQQERTGAIMATAGNTLSTLFSVSKIALKPTLFVVQKAGGVAGYMAGYAVGIPVNIMGNLFGTIINPDMKWNLKMAQQFGSTFQKITDKTIGSISDAIIRL